MQIEKLTTPDAIEKRADYYEKWADDIRALNGTSVDADHSAETAAVLRALTRELEEARAHTKRAAEHGLNAVQHYLALKQGVLTAIDEERLCDDCDNDEDRAYNTAIAHAHKAVERFLSRAQPGEEG